MAMNNTDSRDANLPNAEGGFLVPNEPYRVDLRGFARFKAWITRKPLYVMRPGMADQLMAIAKGYTVNYVRD